MKASPSGHAASVRKGAGRRAGIVRRNGAAPRIAADLVHPRANARAVRVPIARPASVRGATTAAEAVAARVIATSAMKLVRRAKPREWRPRSCASKMEGPHFSPGKTARIA